VGPLAGAGVNSAPAELAPEPLHRLTVAQLVPSLGAGGVERCVVDVNAALVARGHRSLVVSNGGRLVDEVVAAGGEHVVMDLGRKSPLTMLKAHGLRRLLADESVDVLHPQSRMPAWVALAAWTRMPAADRPHFVTSVHGLHSVSWYSRVVTRGERVECVSRVARDYVVQNYPRCDPAKLVVNPRGVDPGAFPSGHRPADRWLAEWRLRFPHLRERFVVTLPGRLTRLKGHHDFLDVIAQLPEHFHGLVVGGEDPKRAAYAQELRDAVAHRSLTDRMTFAGHRTDVRDVLAVSNAVLSLSTKPESFGLTVLESIALGRPTFGYDHGGVGEVLGRLYPAGRVPLGDTAAMAKLLKACDAGAVAPPAADPTLGGFTLHACLDRSLAMYEALADSQSAE